MTLTLAIETSGTACSTALINGREVIDERHEAVGRGHAERLIPMVAELLAGRVPESIAVDCGPGSFTGVRVGLAAARGLGLGWQVPVNGFSSTAIIAAAALAEHEAESVAGAIAGGHGQLFVQCFARAGLRALGPLQSLYPAQAALACRDMPLLAGSGAETLLREGLDGKPRAAGLTRASDIRWLDAAARGLPPVPIYGRAPDARPQPTPAP